MPLSRSAYLARLRRAFLLRVHPDRFRNHDERTRAQQGALLVALSNRMSETDFSQWQQYAPASIATSNHRSISRENKGEYPFVLEDRKGSLIRNKIQLHSSVEQILNDMAAALKKSGAAALPKPPSIRTKDDSCLSPKDAQDDRLLVRQHIFEQQQQQHAKEWVRRTETYNVRSREGRDLQGFLDAMDESVVTERKLSRTDAQAAALEVRRVFKFQAVDATSLGWSSSSVVILLRKLLDLHVEHQVNFRVDSFYPIRLMFTPDDFHDSLDVYGGLLRLNPASTPLQLLEKLQLVTLDTIALVRKHQLEVTERNGNLQARLGIKISKGYSCSNQEYYEFLERMTEIFSTGQQHSLSQISTCTATTGGSHSVTTEPLSARVEAAQACRRAMVTKEGTIRLGAGMSAVTLLDAISSLAPVARERTQQEQENKKLRVEASKQIQFEYGLQKVYYQQGGLVSHDEYMDCISRLLFAVEEDVKYKLKSSLAGSSLGVVGAGQFCHLGDDGSVIVPHNWT